jgi:ComEC/Rec2-related protein
VTGIAIGAACVAGFAFGPTALAAVAFAAVALRIRGNVTTVWTFVVVVAGLAGFLRSVPAPDAASQPWSNDAEAVRGVVVSGPLSTGRGQRFNLSVREYRADSEWLGADAVICIYASELPEVRRGDRVHQVVTIERLEDLPEDVAEAFAARGCSATATAWRTTVIERGGGWQHELDGLRRSMAGRLQAAAPGDEGALMAGLVTGDDGALSDGARNAFIGTGTTHITAVSGSNIAIVLVSAIALGGRLGVHRRLLWQAATSGGVWFYALLVGLEPPAFRAAIVATGVVFAAAFGRRADLVTLTTLAAAIQLLWRPSDYWTLSFRLSFVSALALALVLRGMDSIGVWHTLRAAFVATAAAQIATTPVLISSFGRVSPLSLPTNLVIVPFVGMAFPLAFISSLVGFIFESLGDAIAVPGSLSAGAILRVVRAVGGSEGAQLTVSQPGALTNAVAVVASASTVALFSVDCRRAIQRTWRQSRTGRSQALILGALGFLGFAIGLIAGAAR